MFFRQDFPVGHPNFGKLIPCQGPAHQPERIKRLAQLGGMNSSEVTLRLDNITRNANNAEMLDAARDMVKEPYGFLYIWGGKGNAKTVAMMAILNELRETGRGPVLYTKFSRVVEWMRQAFGEKDKRGSGKPPNWDYITRFDNLVNMPVVGVDEMEKSRETDFMADFRFEFLDERYRQAVAGESITIFSGNHDPSTLDETLWDRIRHGTERGDGRGFRVVHNTAGSARPFQGVQRQNTTRPAQQGRR